MRIRKFSEFNINRIINKIDNFIGIRNGINVSKMVRDNAKTALDDIKSGKIYSDDESAKNLSNVIHDIIKGSLIGFIYLLPGTTIPFTVLRNILRSSKNSKIRRILELTVSKSDKESNFIQDSKPSDGEPNV